MKCFMNTQPHIERHFNESCLIPALRAIGQSRRVYASEALPPHREDYYEIHLITDGSVNWWVENETHYLPPDSVYVTRPGELHGGVKNMIQPCSLTWLQVDTTALTEPSMRAELERLDKRMWLGAHELIGYVTAMLTEIRQPQPDSPHLLTAYLQLFLAHLLRQCRRSTTTAVPDQFDLLLQYIDSHLIEQLSIDDLCRMANLSRSRIFQLFDTHLGQSPISYITSLRVKQAQVRLKQSADTITDIALTLGFSSSQHFATVFRRYTGMSPRQFRQG